MFDLFAATAGIIMLLPLFMVIGFLVKVGDLGPIFFRQVRIGRQGRPFRIWKFRTMSVGAHIDGPSITKRGDARITPIGRILRSAKLDELPQLFNVLTGEMSFVGPRPEVPRYVALYTPEQRRVLELKPGITDLASIQFRNEETLLEAAPNTEQFYCEVCIPRKIELNLRYAATASVISDIKLIMETLRTIIRPQRTGIVHR